MTLPVEPTPIDAVIEFHREPDVAPIAEPDVPATTMMDGVTKAEIPIAADGAVAAEQRFNALTGRLDRFTAGGDIIL